MNREAIFPVLSRCGGGLHQLCHCHQDEPFKEKAFEGWEANLTIGRLSLSRAIPPPGL